METFVTREHQILRAAASMYEQFTAANHPLIQEKNNDQIFKKWPISLG